MTETSLALHIHVQSAPPRLAGSVILANTGTDVCIWRTGNEWGDSVLSFEVSKDDDTWRVARKPQVYTRNVPSSVAVPAHTTHEWPFDLGDGEWEADAPIDQVVVPGASLIAIYDVPPTPEAIAHGVWTGQLRSDPVFLDG